MLIFKTRKVGNNNMAKKEQSVSVFDTKTPKERGDYAKDNPGVMLSPVNFHMLFQIYKAQCEKDAKYKEICKRYTKKSK
jgi:hypothetical protein